VAGDWIKMRGNLWDDPRVSRICDLTGSKEAAVIGGLYWLWNSADQHTENGLMVGLTLAAIDRKSGVKGLSAALVAVGWLCEESDGVRIINFEDHNGASAKRRSEDAKRKANVRKEADKTRTDSGVPAEFLGRIAELEKELEKEKEKEKNRDSVANATGGKPPMSPEEIIFTYGVPLLVNAGSTEKHARSFLGGLRKGRDDADVVNVLRDCLRAKTMQPLEWLAAALPPVGKGQAKPNSQEALEAQNRAVADRFLKGGATDAPH
jgi:hypothetical protein